MKTVALFICLGLFGCSSGNNGNNNGTHTPDMAVHVVLDMSIPPDLAPKNCGAIISCVIASGATNPTAAAGCFQGASTAGATQAGALGLCAFQKCLSGDGGVGANQAALLQCLQTNCSMQLTGCMGLPF